MLQVPTYSELRSFASDPRTINLSEKSHELSGKTVFLSHSSKDNDLLPGAILILENHGGRVCVDDRDLDLVSSEVVEIANRLRDVIKATRKFVMLATPRSSASKWIPWEPGLGDGIHGEPQVALLPSAETALDFEWSQREYQGLYRRIVFGDHQSKEKIWMVINYRTSEAVSLSQWLRS